MENSEHTPDNNFSDEEFNTTPVIRSTFLTVVCILTFIGSGIGIFNGLTGMFTGDRAEQELAEANEQMEDALDEIEASGADEGMMDFVTNIMDEMSNLSKETIRQNSIARLFSNLITLIGAFFMWRLQKHGFFAYLAGTVIWVFSPMLIIGGMLGSMIGIAYSIVGIIMIILYSANFKQLS